MLDHVSLILILETAHFPLQYYVDSIGLAPLLLHYLVSIEFFEDCSAHDALTELLSIDFCEFFQG